MKGRVCGLMRREGPCSSPAASVPKGPFGDTAAALRVTRLGSFLGSDPPHRA